MEMRMGGLETLLGAMLAYTLLSIVVTIIAPIGLGVVEKEQSLTPTASDTVPVLSLYQLPAAGDVADMDAAQVTEMEALFVTETPATACDFDAAAGPGCTIAASAGTWKVKRSNDWIDLMLAVPVIVLLVSIVAVLAGGGLAMARYGGGIISSVIVSGVFVIVGFVLVGVVNTFTGSAMVVYAIVPAYTGMAESLGLLPLAFVIALAIVAIGGMGMGVRNTFMR